MPVAQCKQIFQWNPKDVIMKKKVITEQNANIKKLSLETVGEIHIKTTVLLLASCVK